ncbi:MAG: hypothetical protein DI551_03465 [Micavibrio aeruginosavorus]|uniref:Transglutaminase n=1 Tax=Micavibrio aeruginosavorus TaxID=349221 RepID=A0A2W5N2Q1_9BACT|nr:MAG: hypothetical protein DI551_03465 [Micavibrio aeruginosavorus]
MNIRKKFKMASAVALFMLVGKSIAQVPVDTQNADILSANAVEDRGQKSKFFRISGDYDNGFHRHEQFCERDPEECDFEDGGTIYADLSPEMMNMLREINREVNRRFRYVSDRTRYGRDDYWTIPKEDKRPYLRGDCEDYALYKRKILERVLPKSAMSLAFLDVARGYSHVVLIVRTKQGDYVLDSRRDELRLVNDTPDYSYRAITDPFDRSKWRKVSQPVYDRQGREMHPFI